MGRCAFREKMIAAYRRCVKCRYSVQSLEVLINPASRSLTSTVSPSPVVNVSTTKQPLRQPKQATSVAAAQPTAPGKKECGGHTPDDELDELEEMFIDGPAGVEWGGPTRGGQRPEPTRYGDWERNARVSDF